MADEEKKHGEGEEDLKKKDCPLSPTDWVMFLSGEINAIETGLYTLWAVIIAVLVALVGSAIVFFINCTVFIYATVHIPAGLILLPFALVVYLFFLKYVVKTQNEVKPFKNLRYEIIAGETDSNKIRERWEKIPKILFRKRKRMPVA